MSCLRCGRKTDASFCDECLKTVSLPLPESEFLNTNIHLSAKKSSRPSVITKSKDEKKSSPNKGYIIAVIVLAILCAALACACLWFGWQEIFLRSS